MEALKSVSMEVVSKYDNQNIADIVRGDYRTAEVFRAYNINYCCAGHVPLQKMCIDNNIDYDDLIRKLNHVSQSVSLPLDLQFHQWKTDFLVDYIVNIHHAYLRQALPQLKRDLQHLLREHKSEYPQLRQILVLHSAIADLLENEIQQQEDVLFPYFKQVYSTYRRQEPYGGLLVRTLRKPMMLPGKDPDKLNEYLTSLRLLTRDYELTNHKCADYDVLIKRLHELDNQLVLHKHLENNILFPAIASMEKELLRT